MQQYVYIGRIKIGKSLKAVITPAPYLRQISGALVIYGQKVRSQHVNVH